MTRKRQFLEYVRSQIICCFLCFGLGYHRESFFYDVVLLFRVSLCTQRRQTWHLCTILSSVLRITCSVTSSDMIDVWLKLRNPATRCPRTCLTRNLTTRPSAERSLHHCSCRSEKNQRTEDMLITLLKKVCCQLSLFLCVVLERGDPCMNLVRLVHAAEKN